MRWGGNFYLHKIDGIHKDVRFYRDMLSHLVPDHVEFNPYHLYPIWYELKAKLVGIYQDRVLSGRRPSFWSTFNLITLDESLG